MGKYGGGENAHGTTTDYERKDGDGSHNRTTKPRFLGVLWPFLRGTQREHREGRENSFLKPKRNLNEARSPGKTIQTPASRARELN